MKNTGMIVVLVFAVCYMLFWGGIILFALPKNQVFKKSKYDERQRAEQGKMLVRPGLHIVPAGYGLRVLPQIEVHGPLAGRGQGAGLHLELHRLLSLQPARCGDCDDATVNPGLGLLRHINLHPHAAVHPRRVVAAALGADDVGCGRAVCFGVAQHAQLHGDMVAVLDQAAAAYRKLAGRAVGSNGQLRAASLAAPGVQLQFLRFHCRLFPGGEPHFSCGDHAPLRSCGLLLRSRGAAGIVGLLSLHRPLCRGGGGKLQQGDNGECQETLHAGNTSIYFAAGKARVCDVSGGCFKSAGRHMHQNQLT